MTMTDDITLADQIATLKNVIENEQDHLARVSVMLAALFGIAIAAVGIFGDLPE